MKLQKGFTLIELMVVIVIIGILSALAIPKMFGISAKAKAAEAPSVIANWETLNSAYQQETGASGAWGVIGFVDPGTDSKFWAYNDGTNVITASVQPLKGFGTCVAASTLTSTITYPAGLETIVHGPGTAATAPCRIYLPNF